jgi:topoisomerase IV subunit A
MVARMSSTSGSEPVSDIVDRPMADALSERYLSYALSTIVSRSLPDVRDGLKPVHRRLLFAMDQLRLSPNLPPKKCARVVGDVIGKYHPHGDVSVYDALVRLAQDFAVRYPLVDGQGNFGNIDGDSAAAMRYTEARLTDVAILLLEGLDEDSVDFRDTYDGEQNEPVVLPAAFPNLLANGSSGIAVGMATNIPPHNVAELCDALMLLIDHPQADIEQLVALVPGPDFPTGGLLVEGRAAVLEAYRTGRGPFRLRARWSVEKLLQGTWQIVVTEIPYQVQKSRLIERIADLLMLKKLPLLEDVRDESADDIRLVLVPKSRNVEPATLMEQLFRQTELETRFVMNMNVLDGGLVPRVMNLREVLQAYLNHRHEVLLRRSRHRLGKIDHRLEVLGGLLIAYLNLDEVIRIIREEDEPKQVLIATFALTDLQAESILNMRLRNLRKLEEMEIRREHDGLSRERADLQDLLGDEQRRWRHIGDQVAALRKQFGPDTALGKRRTDITDAPANHVVPVEALIEREPITVFLSQRGWVRALKGHLSDVRDVKYKDGDGPAFVLHAETTDKLLLFAGNGRFYTLAGDKLPGGRGLGEPVRLMVDLPNDVDVVDLRLFREGQEFLVMSDAGRGFRLKSDEALAQTRTGKQVLTLPDGCRAAKCLLVEGDHLAILGGERKLLVFPIEQVPHMAKGQGVTLQKFRAGSLLDATTFDFAKGLSWKLGERTRVEQDMRPWLGQRGHMGRTPPFGFPTTNRFTH